MIAVSVRELSGIGMENSAFVFIKPHAVTPGVKKLVSERLAAKGVEIVSQGSIASEVRILPHTRR